MIASAVTEGISLGDLAAIAGVVVAVVIALLVPVSLVQRQNRRALRSTQAAVETVRFRCDKLGSLNALYCRSHADATAATNSVFDSYAGLLHRVLTDRTREIDVDTALKQLRAIRVGLDRATSEARLISGGRAEQLSALQQLEHHTGNLRTVEILHDIAAIAPVGELSAADLGNAARGLSERLLADGARPIS